MEIEFLRASKNGNLEGVLSLLADHHVNINFQNTVSLVFFELRENHYYCMKIYDIFKKSMNYILIRVSLENFFNRLLLSHLQIRNKLIIILIK